MDTTGFFVVIFGKAVVVMIVDLVAFSVLGFRTVTKVVGLVGCLVVLDDTLDGLFTTVLEAFFDKPASVLEPEAALCTVWNVERRIVCVVVSIVVIVGFFVTNFVVSLNVLATLCVVCTLEITGVF